MAELVVALDFQTRAEAMDMARQLAGTVNWVKVGLELYTANGPDIISELKEMGFKVFADLKFFDIPNTVKGAVRSAASVGADMINIHLTGGKEMALAAVQGRELGTPPGLTLPLLLGVTVLTSMSGSDLGLGVEVNVRKYIVNLARNAKDWYLDGVVCSGLEVESIKTECGPDFLCLTPGIRMAQGEDSKDDQKRVMTPARAVRAGSDYLVVGRPITQSVQPLQVAEDIVREINAI